nr:hypothetical protein WMHIBSEC_WMHIBSEC_CDS_0084 [Caudoviricetes sp.]
MLDEESIKLCVRDGNDVGLVEFCVNSTLQRGLVCIVCGVVHLATEGREHRLVLNWVG